MIDELIEEEENKSLDKFQEVIDEVSEKFGTDENEIKIYLYRKSRRKGGKSEQIDKFDSLTIPDSHEMGITHGSGDYIIWVNYHDGQKNKIKKKFFSLGSHYDKLKENNDIEQSRYNNSINPNIQQVNSNSNDDNLLKFMAMLQDSQHRSTEMMMKMMETSNSNMVTMITSMNGNNNNGNSELMSFLVKNSIENRSNSVNEMTKILKQGIEIGNMTTSEPDNSSDTMDMIKELAPLAGNLLNTFTKGLAMRKIKKNPDIVAKLEDPNTYKAFVKELIKVHGIRKTNEILSVSKLENKSYNPPELSNNIPVMENRNSVNIEKTNIPEEIMI